MMQVKLLRSSGAQHAAKLDDDAVKLKTQMLDNAAYLPVRACAGNHGAADVWAHGPGDRRLD